MQRRIIPDGWRKCAPTANTLIVDLFLVFKTPLAATYDSLLARELVFRPKSIFEFGEREELIFGLWIDLTPTDRYYDSAEVSDEGCGYVKLQVKGAPPSKEIADTFIEVVHTFVREHPGEKVAVHCGRGFNRSGFMIVSYLVEKKGMTLEAAMQSFANARPPGIQKANFLAELAKRYG